MNVEIRHRRVLVALAQSDTYTTAAAMMGTTQPTLSRTMAQLEDIVGVQLVQRTTRNLALTDAGRVFVTTAESLVEQLDASIRALRRDTAVPPLRLGWAWAGFGKLTVPVLGQWKQRHGQSIQLSRPYDPLKKAWRRCHRSGAHSMFTPHLISPSLECQPRPCLPNNWWSP